MLKVLKLLLSWITRLVTIILLFELGLVLFAGCIVYKLFKTNAVMLWSVETTNELFDICNRHGLIDEDEYSELHEMYTKEIDKLKRERRM